jgi:hypothetical protein
MAGQKHITTPPSSRTIYTLFLNREELMMIIDATREGWLRKAKEIIKSRHESRWNKRTLHDTGTTVKRKNE